MYSLCQPTHDPGKTDTGNDDPLQSISPVVDQDLVLEVRLIDDLSVWAAGDSVWLHVPERTERQFIGSYLFLLSPLRTERQAVVVRAGYHHQPPVQSPQSGVSLVGREIGQFDIHLSILNFTLVRLVGGCGSSKSDIFSTSYTRSEVDRNMQSCSSSRESEKDGKIVWLSITAVLVLN